MNHVCTLFGIGAVAAGQAAEDDGDVEQSEDGF